MSNKPSFDSVSESNPEKPSLTERTRTTNEAGGKAYEPFSGEFGLYKITLNNLLEDSYYDSADESFDKLWNRFDEVADTNPEFVLQLATYARQEEGFRDIAQLLLVLSANDPRTQAYVREYAPAIIDRTDEFNSVLSYQLRGYGKPVPKPLKKGITDALHKKYAIVKVEYSGTHETERMTYIEADRADETHARRDRVKYEATESVLARNGMAVDDAETAEALAEASAEVVDEGHVHDEYTFSKYSERDKEVSLHDVLNLVRPKPRSDERNQGEGDLRLRCRQRRGVRRELQGCRSSAPAISF